MLTARLLTQTYGKGFVVLAASGVAMHLLWSWAMTALLSSAYDHRIFDVRRWPADLPRPAVAELVAAFVRDHAAADKPVTMFVGSSFTFGYPWSESVVMSKRYAEQHGEARVLNVSVLGAGLEVLNRSILCGLRAAGRRIDTAILEIPVINAVSRLRDGEPTDWPGACPAEEISARYLPFALKRPIGIGWLTFMWDPYAAARPDEPIQLVVAKGYFVPPETFGAMRAQFRDLVAQTISAARPLADRLVVLPTPVYLPGVAEVGEDAANVRQQLDETLAACRTVASATCLDPEPFYRRRDAYYNMTHLNQHGHQLMAAWLSAKLAP